MPTLSTRDQSAGRIAVAKFYQRRVGFHIVWVKKG